MAALTLAEQMELRSPSTGAAFWEKNHGPSRFSDKPAGEPVPAGPMPDRPASNPEALSAWLREAGASAVSVRSLRSLGVSSPKAALRRMNETGLIRPSRTRGAYFLTGPSCYDAPFGDPLLVAHLLVNPDSRMTMGPRMVPITEGWVARSCSPHYCLPPDAAVPRAFRESAKYGALHRWAVRSPLLWRGRTPFWRYETEIVYVAARPRRYSLDEIHDYLIELAGASALEHLLAELEGRPRSEWMRTCLLLRYGCRRDLAAALLEAAPPGKGPYYFPMFKNTGEARARDRRRDDPIWHPDLELVDYAVDWYLGFRTDRYAFRLPKWSVLAYESGRPDGCEPPPSLPAGYPTLAELDRDY